MSDTPRNPSNGPRSRDRSTQDAARGRTGGSGNPSAKDASASAAPVASAAELAGQGANPGPGSPGPASAASSVADSAASAASTASGQAQASPDPAVTAVAGAPVPPVEMSAAPPTPAGLNAPTRRFEPAILPIAAASVVLVGAVAYLLSSPRERPPAPAAVQQADAARLATVDSRLTALEARPSAEGLTARATRAEGRLDAIEPRLTTAETAARDLAARPVVDPEARAGVAASAAALEAARAATAEAQRRLEERAGALDARVQENARREEARIAQSEATLANRLTAAEGALAARVTAAEQAFAPRLAALDAALQQRVEAAGQAMGQRMDAAGKAMDDRLSQAEAAMNERVGRQEAALRDRVQQFEQRLQQAEAAEKRLGALAARGTLQTALEAGRPLGSALSALSGTPPVALARYRDAAPPTESALRLSFEDAARAARLAAEPQGGTVADSALARLQGLVTVRRGEQVVVGDAVSGELERARRSMDAGDLPGAVERLERLPAPSRNAMAGWIGQARDLVEARAALRDLGTGAN